MYINFKYYTKLDIHKNRDNVDTFYIFMEKVYKYQINDDYQHLKRFNAALSGDMNKEDINIYHLQDS